MDGWLDSWMTVLVLRTPEVDSIAVPLITNIRELGDGNAIQPAVLILTHIYAMHLQYEIIFF